MWKTEKKNIGANLLIFKTKLDSSSKHSSNYLTVINTELILVLRKNDCFETARHDQYS